MARNVKQLTGINPAMYRFRVGDYRAVDMSDGERTSIQIFTTWWVTPWSDM